MKYLSLFSGIGGFELGIQLVHEEKIQNNSPRGIGSHDNSKQYGEEQRPIAVGYSEIDKYAIKIYEKHFKHKNFGDITKINAEELPDFDFLCGGFPCQAFSIAGKRRGFDDTRGTLFFEIARILRAKQPRLFLLENVKGLLSHDNGSTFKTIIATLDELGYDLQWQVLNSKNFGVPQNRERVFIVGHLRGTRRPEVFPLRESGEVDNGEDGQGNAYCLQAGGDKRRGTYIQQLNQPSHFTLTSQDIHGISDGMKIRRLTPIECARLQGFPDNWHKIDGISDTQAYKCYGNAITTFVVRDIMLRLLNE